jgi:site-specific recombinase XerD
LYQQHQVRLADTQELWLTLRAPHRPLTYAAMRRVIQRANDHLGTEWTLHDLRHTAAQRMVADPHMSLTDVQWVLGHAHLTTTEIYLAPREDEVVASVLTHHAMRGDQKRQPMTPPSPSYNQESLSTLLGPVPHAD